MNNHTVIINGKEYPCHGLTDDRRGIITEDQIFWMYPGCYGDGKPVTELPPVAPHEIKAVKWGNPGATREERNEWIRRVEHALNPDCVSRNDGSFCKHTGKNPTKKQLSAIEQARLAVSNAMKEGYCDHMPLYLAMYNPNRPEPDPEVMEKITALKFEVRYTDSVNPPFYLCDVIAGPRPKSATEKETGGKVGTKGLKIHGPDLYRALKDLWEKHAPQMLKNGKTKSDVANLVVVEVRKRPPRAPLGYDANKCKVVKIVWNETEEKFLKLESEALANKIINLARTNKWKPKQVKH